MPKYKQLSIDGVIGDIWDVKAIHIDDVISVVLNVLDSEAVRTKLLNIYHPIGSYFFTDNNVNPGTFLGGTWTNIEGRFLIGASDVYEVNDEGGSADLIVPEHSHTASASIVANGTHSHVVSGTAADGGAHTHQARHRVDEYGTGKKDALYMYNSTHGKITTATNSAGSHKHSVSGTAGDAGSHTHSVTVTVNSFGESGVGKNLPPYKAAYIWKRTA